MLIMAALCHRTGAVWSGPGSADWYFFTGLPCFIPYLGFGIGLILPCWPGPHCIFKAIVMVAVVYGIGQVWWKVFS
jgi:hypothetical protein